jgi:hypothetical protein
MICVHVIVRAFSDAEDVRRNLQPVLASISLQYFIGINSEVYAIDTFSIHGVNEESGEILPLKGLTDISTEPMYV